MVAKPRNDDTKIGTTRTMLVLDDDALTLIRDRAEATGESMGKAAWELIREGRGVEEPTFQRRPWTIPRRPGKPIVTTELVQRLQDELL